MPRTIATALVIALCTAPALAQPAANIGVAATVIDKMQGSAGGQRTIGQGDKVYKDEVVQTGELGKGQLLFLDETTLTVGPNSRVTLDRFVYDPSRGTGTVTLTAVRGTIFELIIELDGTVAIRLIEGGLVFTTLSRQETALARPGQVLTIRPNNGGQSINNGLTERQSALLSPIVDFGAGATTPGQDRQNQLRDQLRGRSGGGDKPPSD